MHRRNFLLTAAAALPAGAAPAPTPLGRLDRFWRFSPVLGPVHETGHGLLEIPSEMLRGDFPYPKRPFPREVPFADHLSMVRLLGGFNDGSDKGQGDPSVRDRDLAFRGAGGKVAYRMNLLRPRLEPYLASGYDSFTFVMDNVPWCFPEKPAAIGLGQHRPPRDPKEWRAFIEAVCRELVGILGPGLAARQRFRVGTENNGRERFDGTHEEYVRHYEHTAAAIRSVIPRARIGPFNISGISVAGVARRHNVNAFALAEHAGATPVDFIAFSRYFRPGDDPSEHARTCREVWEEFGRRVPALAAASREIHEFGVAPWSEVAKGVVATAECGALGAALTAQMMLRLREAGIQGLWHWGPFDTAIRDGKGRLACLPTGTVWVLSVLERMAGGEVYLFPIRQGSPAGSLHLAAGSVHPDRILLLVSAYHRDPARTDSEIVRFHVPGRVAGRPARGVRYVRLGRDNAVHDRIRRDLAAAGTLAQTYLKLPHNVGTLRQMASSRKAEAAAADRRPEHMKQWEESLTLKRLTEPVGTVEEEAGGYAVSLRMAPPEVVAITW